MKLSLSFPSISLTQSSVTEIASAMEAAREGVLYVTDLPAAPLGTAVPALLDHLAANNDDSDSDDNGNNLGRRLNRAYANNLVYKDSWKAGQGGPTVDRKRVLDLSPERLEAIRQADPALLNCDGGDDDQPPALAATLAFWETLRRSSDKLSRSLAVAVGSDELLRDVHFNYRMVDYYKTNTNENDKNNDSSCPEAPRCGEHRDFGSFTLIYAQQPGLELFHEPSQTWLPVPVPSQQDTEGACNCTCTSAVLLFGWCTQIRSNGRIPAALHRVVKEDSMDDGGNRRRVSAVLFTAPKHCETYLRPVVRPGESQQYVDGIQVGQLRGKMAMKWQSREGTLSPDKAMLEEEEIRRAPHRLTQDDVVRSDYLVVS